MNKESRAKEEGKSKVASSGTKGARDREEVEGRVGVEEERERKDAETRGRGKVRHNDGANNAHTS